VAVGPQIKISLDSGDTWSLQSTPNDWRGVAMSSDGYFMIATPVNGYIYTGTPRR